MISQSAASPRQPRGKKESPGERAVRGNISPTSTAAWVRPSEPRPRRGLAGATPAGDGRWERRGLRCPALRATGTERNASSLRERARRAPRRRGRLSVGPPHATLGGGGGAGGGRLWGSADPGPAGCALPEDAAGRGGGGAASRRPSARGKERLRRLSPARVRGDRPVSPTGAAVGTETGQGVRAAGLSARTIQPHPRTGSRPGQSRGPAAEEGEEGRGREAGALGGPPSPSMFSRSLMCCRLQPVSSRLSSASGR